MNKVSYPRNKVLGGIWGLIIGDAVGVPYEFTPQEDIPSIDKIDIVTPTYFRKTYIDVPFGTYSDDGAQFLCVIDSYLECDGFNMNNLAKKLLAWLSDGLWAVDGYVFDVGRQTLKALVEYARGSSPRVSGLCEPEGKGNGALMRTLALAILEDGDDERLVNDSHEQAMITHGHICNQVCCAFYNLIAKYMLEGIEFEEAYSTAVNSLKNIYKNNKEYLHEFENNILPDGIIEERGTGYVIDCLKSAFKIIRESNSYEDAIKKSIALGNDTDTTAAVVGGLAGIIYGFENIPIMSYAAKYSSAFYGPFREAAGSAPSFGNRKGYQMDPANSREAIAEIEADLNEGADIIMVKPAMSYLDIVKEAREKINAPICVYNVSGEYAMVKNAGEVGLINEKLVALEMLLSMKRAGAKMIITYYALEAAKWLKEDEI